MKCKICNYKLKKVLDLGKQPLANKYPRSKKELLNEKKYYLELLFCINCYNSQISKIIDRKIMFKEYFYLSSVNPGLVKHFEKLAIKLKKSNFVLDVGSNDGILLKPLKQLGVNALGIDPSINVAEIANDRGLETIVDFFNYKSSLKIIKHYSMPDVIVASSLFTHLENPLNFAKNVKKLLQKNGLFILEIEYLLNFLKKIEFERFYFDRPFYYSLRSIYKLFKVVDMSVTDINLIDIHGGSLRIFIKNKKNSPMTNRAKNLVKKRKYKY